MVHNRAFKTLQLHDLSHLEFYRSKGVLTSEEAPPIEDDSPSPFSITCQFHFSLTRVKALKKETSPDVRGGRVPNQFIISTFIHQIKKKKKKAG